MKRQQRGRPVHGILLLNKPLGLTSNDALQTIKKIYFAQKAGHTGSLDPLATGMLPICFGEATKFSQFLLDADKSYETTAQFGVITSTSDGEGEVIATHDTSELTEEKILAVLDQFRGDIEQIPSMYSALKHQGKALYEWAREGVTIDREARPITIKKLTLLNFDAEKKTASFSVECSKGTYIRNLIEDIGSAVGCGAYVIALHRTAVGNLPLTMQSLDELEELRDKKAFADMDAYILPLEVVARNLPLVNLSNTDANTVFQGQTLHLSNAIPQPLISLRDANGNFMGLGEIDAQLNLVVKRLISYEFLETGTSVSEKLIS